MLTIDDATVGDAKNYLLEGQVATVALHEGTPLYIDLPRLGRADDQLHRAGTAG